MRLDFTDGRETGKGEGVKQIRFASHTDLAFLKIGFSKDRCRRKFFHKKAPENGGFFIYFNYSLIAKRGVPGV